MPRPPGPSIPSLDELRERFRVAMSDELAAFWHAGDVVARAVRDLPPAERKAIIRDFAGHARVTPNAVTQRLQLSEAFGTESRMLDGATFSMCRAALNAAKRTMRKPADVLREALERGLTVEALTAMGRRFDEAPALLRVGCKECGCRLTLRLKGGAGTPIACPVCAATHGSSKRAPRLGVLK